MPILIREKEVVPGVVVKLRERDLDENYETAYSVQTFDDGVVTWAIPDGQKFSNNWEYIDRAFDRVCQAVIEAMAVG
jgi:hypothetical protein